MNENVIYGISQMHHGHEYRWIFTEEAVSKAVYNDNEVPGDDCKDCRWPIGGSNSSATWIKRLDGDEAIRKFLLAPGDGPDVEDPLLCDIGEYILTVADDCGSCTEEVAEKLGMDISKLEQFDDASRHREEVLRLFEAARKKGLDLDFENPFYGKDKNMRFSELETLVS